MKQAAGNIRIFLGTDTKHAREALKHAIEDEKIKNPSGIVTRFDDLSFDHTLLSEALANVSLFGGRNIVVIDGILDNELGEEFYLTFRDLQNSSNLVFIRETAPKKELHALLKQAGEVKEFALPKAQEKKSDFAVADAIAAKDKRSAWVEFTRQCRLGAKMEEVHGRIFWCVKTLYLCKTQTREEAIQAGVNKWNYQNYELKAKRFLRPELERKLSELKEMYHAAHESDGDLRIFLEQFLLKL
ncbi:MAG: hypothetical protein Q7S52_01480 [bacterium]|nr:hypothetical protein [bacterium]